MTPMIHIGGSIGEGGGQVLRTSLALSACTGTPVRLTGIRAGRKKPGLMAQHLAATLAVRDICNARCEGAELGSQNLAFYPQRTQPGQYRSEVGTAGATTLVAHAALPLLHRAVQLSANEADGPGAVARAADRAADGVSGAGEVGGVAELTVRGGTHVAWSPPFEHFAEVFLPTLRLLGWHAEARLIKHGFYPRGGGQMSVRVEGAAHEGAGRPPASLVLERPSRTSLRILVHGVVCDLPRSIAERMVQTASGMLRAKNWRVRGQVSEIPAPHQGTYLFIRVFSHEDAQPGGAAFVAGGFTGLGKLRKPAEEVAREAATEALQFLSSGAAIDERLADQLLLPAGVSGASLRFQTSRITRHLRTQAEIIERFGIARVRIEEAKDGGGHVQITPADLRSAAI